MLGPARQGLTPLVGFPFSLVQLRSLCSVMAQRVSRLTVGLDVSGLAASNDRREVSQFIVEHFAHFNIHAVQFIGSVAKVTFAVEAGKQQVVSHQGPVPERPFSANPGLRFCSTCYIYVPMHCLE